MGIEKNRASSQELAKGNLEKLADQISDFLKCPITIEDANHKILAYSTHDDQTDPARIATIIGRRVPEKVINALWKEGIIPALQKSEEPIFIKRIDSIGLGDRIAIAIHHNKEVIGYIWALNSNRVLDENGLQILKKARTIVKDHIIKLKKNNTEDNYQEFFWQLLTAHFKSEDEINKKLRNLGIAISYPYSIIIFRFSKQINSQLENQITYILKTTQQIKVIFHTFDDNSLILLASPLKKEATNFDNFLRYFSKQMNDLFGVKSIEGCFGSFYQSFLDVSNSYKEALAVFEIKDKFAEEVAGIYCYQNLGIYKYLEILLKENRIDRLGESYSLKLLKNYDDKYTGQLVNTLEAYLRNDNNLTNAAKELHIHVNTLKYRLKRISEIGDIDLKDFNQKVSLFIELKLAKFQQ